MNVLSFATDPWKGWPSESFGVVCFLERLWEGPRPGRNLRELRGARLCTSLHGFKLSGFLDSAGLPDFSKTTDNDPSALYNESLLYLYSEGAVTVFDPADPDASAAVADLLSDLRLERPHLSVREGNTLHGPWHAPLDGSEGFVRAVVCVTPRPDVASKLSPESYAKVMDHLLTFYDMAGIPALS